MSSRFRAQEDAVHRLAVSTIANVSCQCRSRGAEGITSMRRARAVSKMQEAAMTTGSYCRQTEVS